MKNIVFLSTLCVAMIFCFSALSQDKKMPSPPATAEGTIDGIKIKIDYHQPSARGRKMLGSHEPFGTVWRTGANETTSIEFSGPAKIEGKEIAKGKYALFTIPNENEWTVIINKTIAVGAYSYKESEDLLRVTVKALKTDSFIETFNIAVENNQVVLKWENTKVAFKISK